MNLPVLFSDRMQRMMGEEYQEFLLALEHPPPVSIRLNPGKPSEVFAGVEPIPWHPQGRYLSERPVFTLDPAFHAGAYYVQEASSMFLREAVLQTVDVQQKIRALDLCAAPGGKSTLLLSVLNSESLLVANEVIQSRIPPLRMNLEKWGYSSFTLSNHDPADFGKLSGFFDLTVVDAPCSGEGLFRKDEGAAAEWSEQNLSICASRQRRILTEALELLRPGGVLIYSTCTFNPAENERNVAWLVESGLFDFLPLKIDPAWGVVEKDLGYQFFPHKLKGEGFFIACLKKKTGEEFSFRSVKNGLSGWQRLNSKATAGFSNWLAAPDELSFFQKPNGEIIALPQSLEADFAAIGDVLRKRAFGTVIGTMKNLDFVPSHALAMSSLIKNELPSVELDKFQALHFLKKENLEPGNLPKGWTLARFEGLNLGWMKVLGNRINNYLPNDWRIRMNIV
jgi:16S rRNA C967 or C1407 C5-methylase (RsmB/RsmF family)/NOL1/NOP2/fmu family ribosome biogenesis protein